MNTFQTYIRMNGREIVNGQRILIIAYQSFDWKVTEDARMYKEKSTQVSSAVWYEEDWFYVESISW